MKTNTSYFRCAMLFLGMALLNPPAQAQLALTGTNYTQNFDTISGGLPAGWTVRIGATTNGLGTITTNYNATGNSWGDTRGEFRNCASTLSDAGTNFLGNEGTAIQTNCLNRALSVRQTSSFADPGAAFVLQIANTIGLSNLTFSVDLCTLRTNGYTTIWTVQYGIGNSPDSFTTLGTCVNATVFGATTQVYSLGPDADNLSSNVWIRIAALSAAVGSGNRATFGIDNFSLSWNGNSVSATVPAITGIVLTDANVQIDFTGGTADSPSAFTLQCVGGCSDVFSDANATVMQISPGHFRAVCAMNGSQQFYRIKRP